MNETFDVTVKIALIKKRMTASELASQLGISNAYLSDIINEKRKPEKIISRITEILGI